MICICGAPGYIGKVGVTTWLRSWIWVTLPKAVGLASGPAAGVAAWCACAARRQGGQSERGRRARRAEPAQEPAPGHPVVHSCHDLG